MDQNETKQKNKKQNKTENHHQQKKTELLATDKNHVIY